MKITEARLKELITEEVESYLKENDDKFFKGMVGGGLAAMLPLMYMVNSQNAEDRIKYQDAVQAATEKLASKDVKIAELEKMVDQQPGSWRWTDDSDRRSFESFPTLEINKVQYTMMPPSWTIANQALTDKENGTVNIPGYSPGEIPPLKIIVSALKSESHAVTHGESAQKFIKKFEPYVTLTVDQNSTLDGVTGEVYHDEEDNRTYRKRTVAVHPEALQQNPDYILPETGYSARDSYIRTFFGGYLSSEEMEQFGIDPGKQKDESNP